MPIILNTDVDRPSSEANVGGAAVNAFITANAANLRLQLPACYGRTKSLLVSSPSDKSGYAMIDSYVKSVTAAGHLPVMLGGDHRATFHILRAAFAKSKLAGLVVLDAHTDCQGLNDPLSNYNVLGLVRREFPSLRMILIGARDTDLSIVRKQGIFNRIIDASEFASLGVKGTLDQLHGLMGDQRYYLSIDLDVLDPLSFPCVATPISGGLQPLHLFALIKGLQPYIVGADIVEFLAKQASPLHYLLVVDLLAQLTTQPS